ncbi:class II D-tagatose-bisphosphate aldolase, non-catalytic subunit [Paludibacterium purpuratum]|uniref:Tagatose-bisphosphate aldolase noncatalytic subunit n=1 Tax=Paludibacterium purpuratum TaxID=1144873 RepID=A0A4V3DUK7_9NEIS|nr:class II D-tagatose-bisphosphate aldolase, non-catalytic subunit [Paludibacterium purpuratum]TDR73288.1 tagatose-bisphosphate aldolase noncatalytic subunit [Paludibacterium purpuratum]
MNALLRLRALRRQGLVSGIPSICSAHPLVLTAAMQQSLADGSPLLIEATCNQVNQFGGYTGMTPADFARFVHTLAREEGLPLSNLILGGDHLGPSPWQDEPAALAMRKAGDMVEAYVLAGFDKIHLDASMRCADDPEPLPDQCIAERAAALCLRAEQAQARRPGKQPPVYVIGTEVPTPGGATDEEQGLQPTSAEDVGLTLAISQSAFRKLGLDAAWERVVALVVQPGVEFGDASIHAYRRDTAQALVQAIANQAPWMYEAHSTDYQTPQALRELVEDRFAILKVGPALTFALREALFALELIEHELCGRDPSLQPSRLREVLDQAMRANPVHWRKHYHGNEAELAYARRFSFSDRSRYYLGDAAVMTEIERLLAATAGPLPLALLSQYRPPAFEAVRAGQIAPSGRALALHAIRQTLAHYAAACRPTDHFSATQPCEPLNL